MNAAPTRIQDAYAPYSQRLLDVMLEDYLDEAVAYLERTGRASYHLAQSFDMHPMDPADCERIRDAKVACMYS